MMLQGKQPFRVSYYHDFSSIPDHVVGSVERFTNRVLEIKTLEGSRVKIGLRKLSFIQDANGRTVFEFGEFKR